MFHSKIGGSSTTNSFEDERARLVGSENGPAKSLNYGTAAGVHDAGNSRFLPASVSRAFHGLLEACCFWKSRSRAGSDGSVEFSKVTQVDNERIPPHETLVKNSTEKTTGALKSGRSMIACDVPKSSFFQGGVAERKTLTDLLRGRVQDAQQNQKNDEQLQKDFNRMTFMLDGRRAENVDAIKEFCGAAAGTIIPILNQNIGLDALKTIREHVVESAPSGTAYGAPSGAGEGKLHIGIEKKIKEDGSDAFMIKFYNSGELKSVSQKMISQKNSAVIVSAELDKDSLNCIDDLDEAKKRATLELTKQAEVSVTLGVMVKNDGRIHDHDSHDYSLECLELSNSYHIGSSSDPHGMGFSRWPFLPKFNLFGTKNSSSTKFFR